MPEDKPKEERHTEISEEDYENYVNSYDESTREYAKLYKWKERYYKYEDDYNITEEQVAPI